MTTKKLAKTAIEALLDRKAAEIVLLHVTKQTTLADYYIICTGTSNTQLRAIADAVDESMSKQYGLEPKSIEGYRSASWILLDYGSVIVHAFKSDARQFYDLERLWGDAQKLDIDEFLASDDDVESSHRLIGAVKHRNAFL